MQNFLKEIIGQAYLFFTKTKGDSDLWKNVQFFHKFREKVSIFFRKMAI